MTPTPPSSPEGSGLPPRHRPNIGNLAKDTTEVDLWAFDELDPGEDSTTAPPRETRAGGIPAPRDRGKTVPPRIVEDMSKPVSKGSINVNVGKARGKEAAASPTRPSARGEFDDLDSWDQTAAELPFAEPAMPLPPASVPRLSKPAAAYVPLDTPPVAEVMPVVTLTPVTGLVDMPVPKTSVADDDEFTPHPPVDAVPVTLKMLPTLSKIERVGLLCLLLLLIGGAGAWIWTTIYNLPAGAERAMAADFPIAGKKLTIASADTYWRAPQAGDTSRRGTLLLPVIDMEVEGGPGALRILFRNSDGESVGDAITRLIQSPGKLSVPATAGFDDLGMHAAYRAGEAKPWTIEVREAPSDTSPPDAFKKLFEMNISTARH